MGRKGWARTALALAFLVAPASAYANDPPSCLTDPPFQQGVNENGQLNLSFPSCTDPDGDRLTIADIKAQHGTITGTVYQPDLDFNGKDTITFTASDGVNPPVAGLQQVVVLPENSYPRAAADTANAQSAVELSVPAPGVLANDVDPDGHAMTAMLVKGPSHGTLTLAPDGGYRYTAAAGYVGSDSFTYSAQDSNLTSTPATVTITVANAAPTCPLFTDLLTAEDTAMPFAPGCTDVNGDALTYTFTAVHGTFAGNVYTPNANYNGNDVITYTVSDGINPPVQTGVGVIVTPVNDAPVAADDAGIVNVLANDTDIDGDALSAELVSGPAHGTLTLHPDGTFSYTPAAGFTGTDSFSYRAKDASARSNPATVTLTVTSQPNVVGGIKPTAAPVTVSKLASASRGKALTFTLSGPAKVTIKLVRGARTVKTYTVAKGKPGKNTLKFKKGAFKRGKYKVKVTVSGSPTVTKSLTLG